MKQEHALLTICSRLELDPVFGHARDRDLEGLIDRLGNPARDDFAARLDETRIIHFMSLHVIRGRGGDESSFLVAEISADGRKADVLEALVEAVGQELLVIYRRAFGIDTIESLRDLLAKHAWPLSQGYLRAQSLTGLAFIGVPELSVARIQREQRIVVKAREAIREFSRSGGAGQSALLYLNAARDYLAKRSGDWRVADEAHPPLSFVDSDDAPWLNKPSQPTLRDYLSLAPSIIWVGALLFVLVAVFLGASFSGTAWTCDANGHCIEIRRFDVWGAVQSLPTIVAIGTPLWLVLTLAAGAIAYSCLRESEARNKPNDLDPDPALIREIMTRENDPNFAQNHMISVRDILPEWYRRFVTLPFAMSTIKTALTRGLFRRGFLADIGTIHFARWVVLPGTNRLVFFSNYDGSWESYLEDFIAKSSAGMTGIWSNCVGFPKTVRLFFEGAKDGDRFKRWARASMQPTLFWYSAYPKLTAQQIRTNALICDGLRQITTASDAEAWLELFDSIPRPEAHLEEDEIQGLVLRGLGRMRSGRLVAVRFGDGNPRGWIGRVAPELHFGSRLLDKTPSVSYLALSSRGLAAVGLNEARAGSSRDGRGRAVRFPASFVLGMDDESRQRVLSDYDENGPEAWAWGSGKKVADAVLIIYAPDKDRVDAALAEAVARIAEFDLEVVKVVAMPETAFKDDRLYEPFGYADGISEPQLCRGEERSNRLHDAVPGEFILGYRDNRGFFPPSLLIPADKDPQNILPGPPARLPKRWPQFRRRIKGEAAATRDFGRNGSFLVIRQLEQYVDQYDLWLRDVAAAMCGPGAKEQHIAERLEEAAAKAMGRWRSGVSLIKSYKPPEDNDPDPKKIDPDNDFIYGRDDPQGHLCPFGAHIRRANPRNSLNPDRPEELDIVNRHRLLRRGRPYKDGNEQGLLFMCFNADIERQFEFVQQNWINASSHHGLRDERDPVASHLGECSFTMPSPTGPPLVVERPEAFVRVRGGGYFFMPSRSALYYLATQYTESAEEEGADGGEAGAEKPTQRSKCASADAS